MPFLLYSNVVKCQLDSVSFLKLVSTASSKPL